MYQEGPFWSSQAKTHKDRESQLGMGHKIDALYKMYIHVIKVCNVGFVSDAREG